LLFRGYHTAVFLLGCISSQSVDNGPRRRRGQLSTLGLDIGADMKTTVLYNLFIIRSMCNSRDTLLSEALIYRLLGH